MTEAATGRVGRNAAEEGGTMSSTILARGGRACGYLFAQSLTGVLALVVAPFWLFFGWAIPPLTAAVAGAADPERRRAARYLGLSADLPMPPATERWPGDVVTLVKDRPVRRSLWLLPLAVPNLVGLMIALIAIFAVPSAILSMVLWPTAPGQFSLMSLPVDSWPEALTLGPAQVAAGIGVFWWGAPAYAGSLARWTNRLLSPGAAEVENTRLARRVAELTRSRAGAVDSHGAELRRIERDLHDGTQAQLVSLALRLGVARQLMTDQPERAAQLLDDARDGAEQAMTELRSVLRSMYPPILQDRGLTGAVSALAARSPVPVELRIGELGRVPAAVEAAAYFVVAESLTNLAKHSAATHADLVLERRGPELHLTITDNGLGGAEFAPPVDAQSNQIPGDRQRVDRPAGNLSSGNQQPDGRGSGLHGMRHRVEAMDGRMELTSPIGGPTTVEVVLPCES